MTILLVGASGYLGSRLAAALTDRGLPVTRVGRRLIPRDGLSVELRSAADLAQLVDAARDATVIYCANVGGRAEATEDPEGAYHVNARVPELLGAVARRLIYFSTDYVFAAEGPPAHPWTEPDSREIYGVTKRQGEAAVLQAAAEGMVVRVSGLFDERGTRTVDFGAASRVEAADNTFSTPTAVADVIDLSMHLLLHGGSRIHHCCGPQTLSSYEFHVIAAMRWHFDVRPALTTSPRQRILVGAAPSSRSASATFLRRSPKPSERASAVRYGCVVYDTVGVVLGGRRWKHPDPSFWAEQEGVGRRKSSSLSTADIDRTVNAYTLNPAFPRLFARTSQRAKAVLANNGPSVTFQRWIERFELDRLFETSINSESDGVRKPEHGFFEAVRRKAGNCPGDWLLIDDRPEMALAAQAAGWDAWVTMSTGRYPVERYDLTEAKEPGDAPAP